MDHNNTLYFSMVTMSTVELRVTEVARAHGPKFPAGLVPCEPANRAACACAPERHERESPGLLPSQVGYGDMGPSTGVRAFVRYILIGVTFVFGAIAQAATGLMLLLEQALGRVSSALLRLCGIKQREEVRSSCTARSAPPPCSYVAAPLQSHSCVTPLSPPLCVAGGRRSRR